VPEELKSGSCEVALLEFDSKVGLPKTSEDDLEMLEVLLPRAREDDAVIEIDKAKGFEASEDSVHEPLERGRALQRPKGIVLGW
jgi:hypothetical protein